MPARTSAASEERRRRGRERRPRDVHADRDTAAERADEEAGVVDRAPQRRSGRELGRRLASVGSSAACAGLCAVPTAVEQRRPGRARRRAGAGGDRRARWRRAAARAQRRRREHAAARPAVGEQARDGAASAGGHHPHERREADRRRAAAGIRVERQARPRTPAPTEAAAQPACSRRSARCRQPVHVRKARGDGRDRERGGPCSLGSRKGAGSSLRAGVSDGRTVAVPTATEGGRDALLEDAGRRLTSRRRDRRDRVRAGRAGPRSERGRAGGK